MAFPWTRRDAGTQVAAEQRRRRNRRRRVRREEATEESPQDAKERRHRRLSWALGGVLILVVVGVLAGGYYEKFYHPPRVWAGKVRGVEFTMGDLVERIRVKQGLEGLDLSRHPFQYLQGLMQAEILRQAAPDLGINVTEGNVDQALRTPGLGFYPTAPAGQQTDPGQLEREFRNNFQIYLARTGLSEKDYRGILKEQLQLQWLFVLLGRDIPETMEQVEVEWIRLEIRGPVNAADVMDRLRRESFASVAQSVGVSGGFADPSGYVGWVPEEAFPDIGLVVFGDPGTGQEPLGVGEIAPSAAFARDAIYIVRKLSLPENRPLSGTMRAKINEERVVTWQAQKLKEGADGGWIEMKFNSKLYDWVADQAAISAPRSQPELR